MQWIITYDSLTHTNNYSLWNRVCVPLNKHREGLRDGLRELCAKWTVERRHYCDCDYGRRGGRGLRLPRSLARGASDRYGEGDVAADSNAQQTERLISWKSNGQRGHVCIGAVVK